MPSAGAPPQRASAVRHVEPPAQRATGPRPRPPERDALRRRPDVRGAQVGLAVHREGRDGDREVVAAAAARTGRRRSRPPARACAGVNSRAFASKYASIVGVVVEVVLRQVRERRPRRTRTPSTRCCSSACDDDLHRHGLARPRSRIRASSRCRSGASGVVRASGTGSPSTLAPRGADHAGRPPGGPEDRLEQVGRPWSCRSCR